MKALIEIDERLIEGESEDGPRRTFDVQVADALRLWNALENPEEVLAAHHEDEHESDTRAEVQSR